MRFDGTGPRITSRTLKRIVESGTPVVNSFGKFRGALTYSAASARTIASACWSIFLFDTSSEMVHGCAFAKSIIVTNAKKQNLRNMDHLSSTLVGSQNFSLCKSLRARADVSNECNGDCSPTMNYPPQGVHGACGSADQATNQSSKPQRDKHWHSDHESRHLTDAQACEAAHN